MVTKKKHPYKYVSEDQLQTYQSLSKELLLTELGKHQRDYLAESKKKKSSQAIKDLAADIKDFRKKQDQQFNNDIEDLKEQIKEIQKKRDKKIADAIEEKKSLEEGYKESIANFKEHRNVVLNLLTKMS
jgi:flagellar motility protein MotE (MotC chaperone)